MMSRLPTMRTVLLRWPEQMAATSIYLTSGNRLSENVRTPTGGEGRCGEALTSIERVDEQRSALDPAVQAEEADDFRAAARVVAGAAVINGGDELVSDPVGESVDRDARAIDHEAAECRIAAL